MADKHPYISSGGALLQLLDQLKKSFPSVLNAETLKKLNIAPGNESYALNIARFLGFIDEKGNRSEEAHRLFTLHDSSEFQGAFASAVQTAYKDLFTLQGDESWTLPTDKLIHFFRQSDQSTDLVGTRQASTFRSLATYGGKLQATPSSAPRTPKAAGRKQAQDGHRAKRIITTTPAMEESVVNGFAAKPDSDNKVGLTVRIEVNLPAAGDQETYDKIFRSIKENLLNG